MRLRAAWPWLAGVGGILACLFGYACIFMGWDIDPHIRELCPGPIELSSAVAVCHDIAFIRVVGVCCAFGGLAILVGLIVRTIWQTLDGNQPSSPASGGR